MNAKDFDEIEMRRNMVPLQEQFRAEYPEMWEVAK